MVKNVSSGFLLLFLFQFFQPLWAQTTQEQNYLPDVIIVKVKSSSSVGTEGSGARTLSLSSSAEDQAMDLAQRLGAKRVYQAIPQQAGSKKNSTLSRTSQVQQELSRIYKFELAEGQDLQEAIAILLSSKEVEYAEPYYLPKLLQIPDDEYIPQQTYLNSVKAPGAWEISQGSRDVVIGILDTGVDFDHPDLKDNLYLNLGDPIDGIDNDGDGYIDNYRGWDFANNDNNPSADFSQHGTLVTGFSSASTNNDIGIAGTGYKCRYMPLKIFRSENNVFSNGYEAIVYAANMGCDVINLSWGAAGIRSQYVQDIINYVVFEKDVVVVAAAGNENKELNYYPASYDNVLSVTSSDLDDKKSDYATWSRYVDLMAPGNNVLSTQNGGRYGSGTGTSFASPIVAGGAALVRSYFPELNAQQVIERLRMSTDDVSNVKTNPNFKEKIGKGRLNMEKALSKSISPAVRMQQFDVSNGTGPYAFYNDTLEILMDFKNFLNPSTNLKVELTTNSEYVTILDGTIYLNAINTMETVRHENNPFRVYLHPDLPNDQTITFRLGYSDLNYQDYQHFELRTNGEFLDFKVDDLSLTISSNGNLGYNFDYNLNGSGFRFQNSSLAHNLGLVLAASNTAVANNMPQTINPVIRNKDFRTLNRLKVYNNSTAYRDARSVFETRNTEESPLDLLVEQKILGWKDDDPSSGIVLEYRITNRSATAYPELYAGMFADFDIQEFYRNKGAWDADNLLGYAYDHQQSRFTGLALLNSEYEVGFHALDLAARNGNISEYTDSLTRAQKYGYLANGIGKTTAGTEGSGNDVAHMLGAKIPGLAANQSRKVAFALVTASTLGELKEAVQLARNRYQEYLLEPPVLAHILACPGANITFNLPEGETYKIYSDPFGEHLVGEGSSILLENLTESTTVYVANVSQDWLQDIEQVKIEVKTPVAAFAMSSDTLSINPGETALLQLTDHSQSPKSWLWDFNNGYKSTKQSPKTYFNTPGNYSISLTTTNDANCTASIIKNLVVVYKEALPLISDQILCNSGSTTLQTEDGTPFTLYADAQKRQKLYSGTSYTTGLISSAITYYATNGVGAYESDPKPITITVAPSGITFSYIVDSTDATERYALQLQATTLNELQAGRIDWFINGSYEGSGKGLLVPYNQSETSIQAEAIVFHQNGCQASSRKEIILSPSPKPVFNTILFCEGSDVMLRPREEGLYYFYADPEKTSLRKKGREYLLESVSEEGTYYVTNVSNGIESDTSQVKFMLQKNLASFSPLSDTIFLGSSIQFTSLHPEASQHLWNFGNGITSRLASPVQLYNTQGNYTITLTTTSKRGCTETHSRTFQVVSPTGIDSRSRAITTNKLRLSPNPVQDQVWIEFPSELQTSSLLLLKDVMGRTILQKEIQAGQRALLLHLPAVTAGWYLLQAQNEQEYYTGRFLKE